MIRRTFWIEAIFEADDDWSLPRDHEVQEAVESEFEAAADVGGSRFVGTNVTSYDRDAPPHVDDASEYGRLLAERDRLIAAGVAPEDLELPLPPPGDD